MASSSLSSGKTNVNANSGPSPASIGGVSIHLLPVTPLPAGYSFSQATEHDCLVCQIYTIIDQFAKDCRLQNLWNIRGGGASPAQASTDPASSLSFDATELLQALGKISDAYHLASADRAALLAQVQRVGSDIANDDVAGKTIKFHLVDIKTRIAPLEANVNTYNDALKELDDEIKHLDLQVTTLKTQQYDATKILEALTSYNSKPPPSDPLKAQRDVLEITEKLRGPQNQLNDLNVERPRKKKLYDDAVAAAAPFVKLRNDQVDCMALALWIKFIAMSGVDPRDHVARARLFFSWVAYSIRYDMDLKAKNAEGVERKTRPTADTVMTGMEICGGYSELFRQMFDATDLLGQTKAMYIGGKTKRGTWKQDEPKRGHAWSVFPTSDGEEPVMKLIDPCWGAGSDPDATSGQSQVSNNSAAPAGPSINPLYFTMSNEDFLRDHLPNQSYLQYVDPEITKAAFWASEAAMFGDPNLTQYFNRSTINPAPFTIRSTGIVTFSFSAACPHVYEKGLIKPLFLAISTAAEDPDITKLQPFEYNAATQRWSAQMDLTKVQAKGYYFPSIRAAVQNGVQLPCRTVAELKAVQGKVELKPVVWWRYGDVPDSELAKKLAEWERSISKLFF